MTYNNPNLVPELRITNPPDPGAAWQSREAAQSMRENAASDNNGFARAVTENGQVVSTQSSPRVVRGSYAEVVNEATAAAGVPWIRALDPVNKCSQSPDQVTDDSIITLPTGQEVTLRDAKRYGLIASANRPFEEGQEQPKEEVHPDLAFDLLADEAADRDYSALVDSTGGIEQAQAIEQIVQNGEIDGRTLGTLASQLRCEPEQLAARVAPVMKAFEEQARSVMSEGGLDSNAVVAWAQQNAPDKLKAAMNRQATMRQTAGYAELRQGYLENLGKHSPEVALKADLGPGITTFLHPTRGVMVRIPGFGDGMPWKAAIKAFGPK